MSQSPATNAKIVELAVGLHIFPIIHVAVKAMYHRCWKKVWAPQPSSVNDMSLVTSNSVVGRPASLTLYQNERATSQYEEVEQRRYITMLCSSCVCSILLIKGCSTSEG
jgi:hypothetical protein